MSESESPAAEKTPDDYPVDGIPMGHSTSWIPKDELRALIDDLVDELAEIEGWDDPAYKKAILQDYFLHNRDHEEMSRLYPGQPVGYLVGEVEERAEEKRRRVWGLDDGD